MGILACYVLLWGVVRFDLCGKIMIAADRLVHRLLRLVSGAVDEVHQLALAFGMLACMFLNLLLGGFVVFPQCCLKLTEYAVAIVLISGALM
ncbi:hypothetical protein DM01DRAFT_299569 [Hesseltinella vesiculosa]|uniref:Uncharacterized protein n=1 Tax=Hesseltinella vesiculosa TaxID=101127 RepID=A0A1X2GKH3_9FUNG|nr:hypothetical protein DM01DRAFT_299569 [Hesseltinella vesiculosa]